VTKNGITWRAGARTGALLIALGALAAGATVAGAGADAGTAPSALTGARVGLVAATAGGAVRGKAAQAMDEFLGIPYAAPPVGPLSNSGAAGIDRRPQRRMVCSRTTSVSCWVKTPALLPKQERAYLCSARS